MAEGFLVFPMDLPYCNHNCQIRRVSNLFLSLILQCTFKDIDVTYQSSILLSYLSYPGVQTLVTMGRRPLRAPYHRDRPCNHISMVNPWR